MIIYNYYKNFIPRTPESDNIVPPLEKLFANEVEGMFSHFQTVTLKNYDTAIILINSNTFSGFRNNPNFADILGDFLYSQLPDAKN